MDLRCLGRLPAYNRMYMVEATPEEWQLIELGPADLVWSPHCEARLCTLPTCVVLEGESSPFSRHGDARRHV